MIRNRAMDNQTYSSSVIPFGYVGVKKEEKVVFPDDTVYFKTMDLFLFFSLGLYGPGCTTCGVGVSDIGWIRIRA
jgi:hypothetical protein